MDATGKAGWAYWALLPYGTIPDGTIEVRAIIYGNTGIARILQDSDGEAEQDKSLYVYANVNGSLPNSGIATYVDPSIGNDTYNSNKINNVASPFLTVSSSPQPRLRHIAEQMMAERSIFRRDRLTFIKATGPNSGRWLTIKPAPGAAKANIVAIGSTANGSKIVGRVRVEGVTLQPPDATHSLFYGDSNSTVQRLWVKDCDFIGLGTNVNSDPDISIFANFGSQQEVYVTGCTGLSMQKGWGSTLVKQIRDCTLGTVSGDLFSRTPFVLNCSVDTYAISGEQHPDLYQTLSSTPLDNLIVCNLKCTNMDAQGLFLTGVTGGISNSAFVNIDIEKTAVDALVNNFNTPFYGVRFSFISIKGQGLTFGTLADPSINLSFVGCVLEGVTPITSATRTNWASLFETRFCHFITTSGAELSSASGTSCSDGAAGWDLRSRIPTAPGNLATKISNTDPAWIPFDVTNKARASTTAIGANAGDDE